MINNLGESSGSAEKKKLNLRMGGGGSVRSSEPLSETLSFARLPGSLEHIPCLSFLLDKMGMLRLRLLGPFRSYSKASPRETRIPAERGSVNWSVLVGRPDLTV